MIRVVIAEDHAVVRRGLCQVLHAEKGFEVVAEASDLDRARRYVRGHHPDVLILDLNPPDGLSLEAIPEVRPRVPDHDQRGVDLAGDIEDRPANAGPVALDASSATLSLSVSASSLRSFAIA